MAQRGVELYKIVIPQNSAVGTTIYDCDPVTGEVRNQQDAIFFGPHVLGNVYIDSAAWTDAELGLKVCYKRSATAGDYLAFLNEDGSYDSAGEHTTVLSGIVTNAKKAYVIPPRWCDAGWARLHSVDEATGNDVNQTGADKTIWLTLKS